MRSLVKMSFIVFWPRGFGVRVSGYKQKTQHCAESSLLVPTSQPQSAVLTAPFRVASGKETAQWAFPTSSLRQQDRLYRPLPMVGSGVPAAAIFCENLADADDAALMRLDKMKNSLIGFFQKNNNFAYVNQIEGHCC